MKSYVRKILSDKYSLTDKWKLLNLPHIYVADSVKDFQENKTRVKPSFFNYFQDPGNRYYTTIFIPLIGLRSLKDKNGSPILAENESHEKAFLFELYDKTGFRKIYWPLYDSENHLTRKLNKCIGKDSQLQGIFLCYDKEYDNAFVSNIFTYIPDKSLKSIDDIIKEVWPNY